jgi:hypothetical protein
MMTRKRLVLMFAVVASAVGMAGLSRAQEPNLDSLIVCKDSQKLLFENSFVRIIDDVIPPGGAEARHQHPHGVVVTLAEADVETVNSAGRATKGRTRLGANWAEPTVHEVRNVGTTPTHWIRIDLK